MAWTDLTSRQQMLDKEIERLNFKLDSSIKCLQKVMKSIDAKDNEKDYVKSRIKLRLKTQALLDNTDLFINTTENMLEKFKEDDKEWERKGKKLGFNFWD